MEGTGYLLRALTVLAALLAAFLATADPAAAATLQVDDDGIQCPSATFTSIQAAVDAASSGDTIEVCEGTYSESVNVNKTLTLEGAQAGADARTRTSVAETIVDPLIPFQVGLNVTADDVTIDGFTVQGTLNATGIALSASKSGYQIVNNIIQNNTFGLYLNSSGATETLVEHNLFQNNNVPGSASGDGIYADAGTANVSVNENKFTGHTSAAMVFAGTQSDLEITDNELVSDSSIVSFNTTNLTITGNVSTNSVGSGIFLDNNDNVLVQGNTITNQQSSGVALVGGNDNVSIQENTITGAATVSPTTFASAVSLSNDASGANTNVTIEENTLEDNERGVHITSTGVDASGVEIHFNRIDGNSDAGLSNDSNNPIDAENNWWGCNEGPNNVGCDGVTGTAAGQVDFDPWLVLTLTAGDTTLGVGQQTTLTADMTINSNGEDTSSEGVIPDGEQVTFASDRGTVNPTTATITNGTATSTLTAQNLGEGSATATVDNETASVAITVSELSAISINNVKREEGDQGTTSFKFTVTLDKPSDEQVTVEYATENGTAKNNDYNAKSGTITFAPGDTSERIRVEVNGDTKKERNETFFVNLSDASENATIADDRGRGTIDNDDSRR